MISQKTQLQIEVQGKNHLYQCEPNCSLQEVLEALSVFRSYIYGRMKEDEEQKKSLASNEQPKSE